MAFMSLHGNKTMDCGLTGLMIGIGTASLVGIVIFFLFWIFIVKPMLVSWTEENKKIEDIIQKYERGDGY